MKGKWLMVTGMAMALPSTIFGVAYFLHILYEKNLISKLWAFIVLMAVVLNIFFLMIYYASSKKNKP